MYTQVMCMHGIMWLGRKFFCFTTGPFILRQMWNQFIGINSAYTNAPIHDFTKIPAIWYSAIPDCRIFLKKVCHALHPATLHVPYNHRKSLQMLLLSLCWSQCLHPYRNHLISSTPLRVLPSPVLSVSQLDGQAALTQHLPDSSETPPV